jgi:hypothetical protein
MSTLLSVTPVRGPPCNLPTATEFEPTKCLCQLNDLMNPGGILVIVSPSNWFDEFTKEDTWLEGTVAYPDASRVVSEMVLAQGFDQVHEEDMPRLIRQHERKYHYIVSHGTCGIPEEIVRRRFCRLSFLLGQVDTIQVYKA